MPGANNRKRTKKRPEEETSLWGFLFDGNNQSQDITKKAFFGRPGEEEEEETEEESTNPFLFIWRRFNFWSLAAIIVFLAFVIVLVSAVCKMWTPQNMRDLAGYSDNGSARDLTAILRSANGQEISFTEAELNRFLRETCRIRQTGVFSIITHGRGLGVRIHDGYMELIIERMIGANIHQTTSVNLTFSQHAEQGRPELEVAYAGGEPLAASVPRGGSIGMLGIPDRHVSMLTPALRTLLDCYPEIVELIKEHGYCPYFTKGQNGNESRVRLVPYQSSN